MFKHLRAAHVLNTLRAMARSPKIGAPEAALGLDALRHYTEVIGTKEARAALTNLQEDLQTMVASPAQSKAHVHAGFQFHRSTKDFHKGKND